MTVEHLTLLLLLAMIACFLAIAAVMYFRCKHDFVEVTRTFVDPVTNPWRLGDVEYSRRTQHVTGFTVVLFKCSKCHATKKEEMQGHVHRNEVVSLKRVK